MNRNRRASFVCPPPETLLLSILLGKPLLLSPFVPIHLHAKFCITFGNDRVGGAFIPAQINVENSATFGGFMKFLRLFLAWGLGLTALICATLLGQPRDVSPTRQMMRQKLEHAQSALEGITMSDFALVRNHSARLAALSQEAHWRAYDTPEYAEQSLLFKRTVEALLKAGKEENLDAATLAYTKMTFSCVECHKYIRSRSVAFSIKQRTLTAERKEEL